MISKITLFKNLKMGLIFNENVFYQSARLSHLSLVFLDIIYDVYAIHFSTVTMIIISSNCAGSICSAALIVSLLP